MFRSLLCVSTKRFGFRLISSQFLESAETRTELQNSANIRGQQLAIEKIYSQCKLFQENNEYDKLVALITSIPNTLHPEVVIGDASMSKLLYYINLTDKIKNYKTAFNMEKILQYGRLLQVNNMAYTAVDKSYVLIGDLAHMEEALIRYTFDFLRKYDFLYIPVKDVIDVSLVDACGFPTTDTKTQLYKLVPERHGHKCLSATGEFQLAGQLKNKVFQSDDLPLRLITVSRCHRAERSEARKERALYRVLQFFKVEMFAVCRDLEESNRMLEEFREIQTDLYSSLGLYCRVLDMASAELGFNAYRKYDIEAWMPDYEFWGEISSTSNCTDFQARRLNVTWVNGNGDTRLCHTVNGTACAVPRLIKAITEQSFANDETLSIPHVLKPYMDNKDTLDVAHKPKMRFFANAGSPQFANKLQKALYLSELK